MGRDQVTDDLVQELIAGRNVALVGGPGVGKTALAVKLARDERVRSHFADGVLWGGLGRQPDPASVLLAWGAALQVDVSGVGDVTKRRDAVKAAVGQRRLLLVLEDGWDAASVCLLRCGGPNAIELLTTRLHDLPLESGVTTTITRVEPLEPEPAFDLLRALAPKVSDAFPVEVAALAKAVGYLPLALELMGKYLAVSKRTVTGSARRTALTDLQQARNRLALAQQRLGEVSGERTLAEVILLSVEGLSPATRATFGALAAFAPAPARFDAEAAAVVLDDAEHEALGELVQCSLVEASAPPPTAEAGEDWFGVHQTIADVAATTTPADAIARHRQHYLALVNAEREDYRRIEAAYPQLRHAWQQMGDDAGEIDRYLDALGDYQKRRGLWAEREEWLQRGLRQDRTRRDRRGEGAILNNLGNVYQLQGRWDDAIRMYEHSLAIFRALGDRRGEGNSLMGLGVVYDSQGRWDDAIQMYEQSLTICRALGDRPGEGQTLNNLGIVYQVQGRWDDAIQMYKQALTICHALGDRHGESQTLTNLGNVYQDRGRWDKATQLYEESLVILRGLGDRRGEGLTLNNLGVVYRQQGRWNEAIRMYEQSLTIKRALGDRHGEGNSLMGLGLVYYSQGHWDEATQMLEQALAIFLALGDRQGEGQTLNNLGVVYRQQERWDEAIQMFEQDLAIRRALGDRHGEGMTLMNLGVLHDKRNRIGEACAYWGQALEKLNPDSPACRRVRGWVEEDCGDADAGG